MKLLITGYSGFVGTHLVDAIKESYSFSLLGRRSPNFTCEYLQSSINSEADYSSILTGVDVVIHAAGLAHVVNDKSKDSLKEYRSVNLKGTLNLAKQASEKGVKRFIFISTVKVNGEKTPLEKPFTHEDARQPQDFYGLSKSEAEEQIEKLSKDTGMDYVFIRPPLVYGQGVKANFSALMKLTIKKIPLPFGAIKSNRRSLVSVYNLVDLIKVCIEHPNASNQIFLVSDGEDLSTTAMVKLMADVQSVKPLLLPLPVWLLKMLGKLTGRCDMISRLTDSLRVDITHTQETLSWTPPYSVTQGFAKSIERVKNV